MIGAVGGVPRPLRNTTSVDTVATPSPPPDVESNLRQVSLKRVQPTYSTRSTPARPVSASSRTRNAGCGPV